MDISTLSTPTQIILALLLFVLLLAWLIIFAMMAFRTESTLEDDFDDLPTPAGSFPSVSIPIAQQTMLTSLRVQTTSNHNGGSGYEVVKENGMAQAPVMRYQNRD